MVLRRLPLLRRALGTQTGDRHGTQRVARVDTSSDMPFEQEGEQVPTTMLTASSRGSRMLDEEVSSAPRRRLVPEAEHGMWDRLWNQRANYGEAGPEEEKFEFHEFYETRVKEVQDAAGGEQCCPISGNLYMYRALRNYGTASGLFVKPMGWFVLAGLTLVMVLQVVGPIFIILSSMQEVQVGTQANWYTPGSKVNGVTNATNRILSLLFLLLFVMNGLYVVADDRKETKKLIEFAKACALTSEEQNLPPPKECWFWVGALINSLCLIGCSLAMVLVFVTEDGPSDTILDAFGLTFLYNLDDIGGDMSFLDEVWDEDFMGDIYGSLQKVPEMRDKVKKLRKQSFTPDNIYSFTNVVMWILLFALPIFFFFLEPKPEKGNGRRLVAMGMPETEDAALELLRFLKTLNDTTVGI